MRKLNKLSHRTKLKSANIVHSGSGNISLGSGFVPTPSIPVNNSNLPNRHPNFVGRHEEIKKTMDALASRAWIVTIDGMGGIGKTTLALEVAHLCRDRDPDYPAIPNFTGYIWTSARDKSEFSLNDVIREILYVLSPFENTKKQLSQPELLSLAIRLLAVEPRLLIIDNFETVKDEQLHRFLRDRIPNPSKVMITSRHHLQEGEKVVTIGGLEENDAIQLLQIEASRLQIPVSPEDSTRLLIIARKSYGIPQVLRWAMDSVYNGKSLEWVVESLENATADDIFDYIFKRSLEILDPETRRIFRSMSLLATWTSIKTISALNPGIAAIQERLGRLVSLSLVDDNRKLVQSDRRYQLPSFARYLASKELHKTDDRGKNLIKHALKHYISELDGLNRFDKTSNNYLETEFINISNIVKLASAFRDELLIKQIIKLGDRLRGLDNQKGRAILGHLIEPVSKAKDKNLAFRLINLIGNPYIAGMPVDYTNFFGRTELLSFIQKTFESERSSSLVISLIGPRRIGKTSLLLYFRNQESTKCKYIYFDLQGIIKRNNNAEFLYSIVRQIEYSLHNNAENQHNKIPKLKLENFLKSPLSTFQSYLDYAIGNSEKRLVLMFDEFNYFFYDRNPEDSIDLLNYLRSIVQRGNIGIITAGVTPLFELPSSDLVSPFFNIALIQRISFLEREEAIALIQQPVYGLLKYDNQAIEFLLKLSGCHPFLLQMLCYEIFNLCLESGKLMIDFKMVEDVLPTVSMRWSIFFEHISRKSDITRKMMKAASILIKKDKDAFTIEQLKKALQENEFEENQIEIELAKLMQNEFLVKDDQGNYKFTMEIVRRYFVETATH